MTELEQLLEQIEDIPKGLSAEELKIELNKRSRELGRKQMRVSANTKEYQDLGRKRELAEEAVKLLRKKEKEDSGLMPVGTAKREQEKEQEKKEKKETPKKFQLPEGVVMVPLEQHINECFDEYQKAQKENDVKAMQRAYRELSILAESGNGQAINGMGMLAAWERKNKAKAVRFFEKSAEQNFPGAVRNIGILYMQGNYRGKDLEKARAYLDRAAALKGKLSMYNRTLELAGITKDFEYWKSEKEAYAQAKAYLLEFSPLNLKEKTDRAILYYCYKLGYGLKLDMENEGLPEHWERLLENEGTYSQKAKTLRGDALKARGEYKEAERAYFEADNLEGLKAIEEMFFESYFEKNRAEQIKLDDRLAGLRDNEQIEETYRAELYRWYGWRYEYGKGMIPELPRALHYYWKAANLGHTDSLEAAKRIYLPFKKKKELQFFKEAVDMGCYEMAEEAGDLCTEKHLWEEALSHYKMGHDFAMQSSVRENCKKKYLKIKQIKDRKEREFEECEPIYNSFRSASLAGKMNAFREIERMAESGNAYAALRLAQILEGDEYIRDCIDFEGKEKQIILKYYQIAADGFEAEAIRYLERRK